MAGKFIKAKEGDLQSCPFCGSSDIYYRKYDHAAGVRWAIFCADCMAEIDTGCAQTAGQARQLWNRRAK